MKKTFEEMKKIDAIYGELIERSGKEGRDFKATKLGYAFKRFSEKNLVKPFGEFNETLQDMRIDNALVDDKTKAVLFTADGKNYQNTKEQLKTVLKRSKEIGEEWDKKEFEIIPFICSDLGDVEFTEDEVELLKGVIIE